MGFAYLYARVHREEHGSNKHIRIHLWEQMDCLLGPHRRFSHCTTSSSACYLLIWHGSSWRVVFLILLVSVENFYSFFCSQCPKTEVHESHFFFKWAGWGMRILNNHSSAKSQLILHHSISGCTLWTQVCLVLLEADSKSYKPFFYEEQEGQLPSGAIPKKVDSFF